MVGAGHSLEKNVLRYIPGKKGIEPESAASHVLGSQRCNKRRLGEELAFLWSLDFLSLVVEKQNVHF